MSAGGLTQRSNLPAHHVQKPQSPSKMTVALARILGNLAKWVSAGAWTTRVRVIDREPLLFDGVYEINGGSTKHLLIEFANNTFQAADSLIHGT